jgi:hypothetical protein
MRLANRALRIAVLGIGVCLGASPADAQDKAAAETAFAEGRRLALNGDFAGACARFEASERLEPATGTLLNLAECYGKLGRSASEWAALREASARAALAKETQRAELARAKADELEPTLAKLELSVPKPVDGLEIERDGVRVDAQLWGTPVPVDPGPHVIQARAPRTAAWSDRIEVAQGPVLTVVVVPQPALDSPTSERSTLHGVTPQAADRPSARESTGASPIGLITFSAGCGGLVAAAIAGVGAIERKNAGEREEALGWAQAFDWIAVPSAVAVVAGIVMHVMERGPAVRPLRISVAPTWGPRRAGVGAELTF